VLNFNLLRKGANFLTLLPFSVLIQPVDSFLSFETGRTGGGTSGISTKKKIYKHHLADAC
jgi:hypothetical protein